MGASERLSAALKVWSQSTREGGSRAVSDRALTGA